MTELNPNSIYQGDALEVLKTMPDESVDMIITSPPYWGLRDYGSEEQLGLEPDFRDYVNRLADIFDEARRVLKSEGSLWVNLGDTYGGKIGGGMGKNSQFVGRKVTSAYVNHKRPLQFEKSLMMIPARFSIEMIDRGWILRNKIIWQKPNAMPQSVKDRFSVDYEEFFFFTKSKSYYFEQQFDPFSESTLNDKRLANKDFVEKRPERGFVGAPSKGGGMLKPNEKGRNKRSVWNVSTISYKEAHFAVYPPKLLETPIKASCPLGGGSPRSIFRLRNDRSSRRKARPEMGRYRVKSRVYRTSRKAVPTEEPNMKKVLIGFDIDGTLRSNTVDQTKAPVANEDIRTLLIILSRFKNTKILVWSGGGELYARQVVASLGLSSYVDQYADKEYIACQECKEPSECNHHNFGTKIRPDIAIDDIQACTLGKINLIARLK